jgi:predicted nuclease of predicted toxin-antitoxin system
MKLLLDAHLSPAVARWMNRKLPDVQASSLIGRGLAHLPDHEVIKLAQSEACVLMSKDRDYPRLASEAANPPPIIFLRCGNTSVDALIQLLDKQWQQIRQKIEDGAPVVMVD